jgi:hypothetical protein
MFAIVIMAVFVFRDALLQKAIVRTLSIKWNAITTVIFHQKSTI